MNFFLARAVFGSLICFTSMLFAKEGSLLELSRASIRHIEGGGIGYSQGYTTLDVFSATEPELFSATSFLDLRGHLFDNGKWAANAGFGTRKIFGCRSYGVNGFYDYRSTRRANYSQVGVGLETLGTTWDVRLNGYLPVGHKSTHLHELSFYRFSGHEMILSDKYQVAMKGVDAEVGFCFGKSKRFNFYAAAGPYYYIGQAGSNIWGGKGRLRAIFKEWIHLELSNSYDATFKNKFQGELSFSFPLGRKRRECQTDYEIDSPLRSRMVESVGRKEIIVVSDQNKHLVARDRSGAPLFFVFVDNTSHSNGTYQSPYPTFALAEANSKPGDIIYVFPGNGTTEGMDSGISLKANQKFWGSGVSHLLQTSQGIISIPAESSSSPTITNTNINTEGNAITLATHNGISGFTIASAMNDAIYGVDPQSLVVSSCLIKNSTTYAIETSFPGAAVVSLMNNQFLNNVNGVFLDLNGTSIVVCSDNTFTGQTSISSVPLEIAANSNAFITHIENNLFNDNTTGSIRFGLDNVVYANITAFNNTITNNGTGSQDILGSSFVVLSDGIIDYCSIALEGNTFSGNSLDSLRLHTSGEITALEVMASKNRMSDNGGSALVLATPVDALKLLVTNNIITGCNNNGIAVISSGLTSNGDVIIKDNRISGIQDQSNGIAINQDFSTLNLTILNNKINACEGTGIVSYAPTGIDSLILNVSGNTISNCENLLFGNSASAISISQYTNLAASIANNALLDNTDVVVAIGSTLPSPTVCLTLTGNNSSSYLLTNPFGLFNLSPCNVEAVNRGVINSLGVITPVQSCSNPTPCPPP